LSIEVGNCGLKWGNIHCGQTACPWSGYLVEQMFLGEFEHTLDSKGRLTIPAKFRGRLAAGVVVTKGIDSCLWLYPLDTFKELAPKINAMSLTMTQAREFRRQVFGGASDSIPDKQGRVNLPTILLEYANIDKQAVIIGVFDHCEIWNPEHWRERQENSHKNPEWWAQQFESLNL
jgi:MraZ protein